MDPEFVEEFDTSSSESESEESSVTKPKFDNNDAVSSNIGFQIGSYYNYPPPPLPNNQQGLQPYYQIPSPSLAYGSPYHHYGYGLGLGQGQEQRDPYPPPPPPPVPNYANSNSFIRPHLPFSDASSSDCNIIRIPQGLEVAEQLGALAKKKKRRTRKTVKLSDYSDCLRKLGWEIYEKGIVESKLEKCVEEKEKLQITQTLEPINKDVSTFEDPQPNSCSAILNKIVNRIKSQRHKRLRDKVRRGQKQMEKQKELLLAREREAEIDKWLKDQRILFEAERSENLIIVETKKSLEKITRRRKVILDRIKLLDNLQKIRQVRKSRMINTQPGVTSASMSTSDREFSQGLANLYSICQRDLEPIEQEEKIIRLKIVPDLPAGNILTPEMEKASSVGAGSGGRGRLEDRRLKVQRKWEKRLSKRGKLYLRP